MTQPTRSPGFTLAELMITVAVIGILGLVTVPGILAGVPAYRVNNATKALATELNLARMRAVARNRVHHVAFYPATEEIKVWEDEDEDWATANTLVKTVDVSTTFPNVSVDYNTVTGVDGAAIPQAVEFGTTATPVRAVFLPNGLMADPGVLYLLPAGDKTRRNDRMRAIQASRAGLVARLRYDASLNPPWREY
jgi:prepilin-type N-terminal cleavage/methylation domain-containing protein